MIASASQGASLLLPSSTLRRRTTMTRTNLVSPPAARLDLLCWAGLATVALWLAGVGPAAAAEAAKLPDDLAWVPAGGTGFVTLHLAELWQTEHVKSLRKALTRGDPRALQEAEAKMGMEFEQIERVTVV